MLSQITIRVAAFTARKVLTAQGSKSLDMLVRLQFLEGAAGRPINSWVGGGSTSSVAKGLQKARDYFGEDMHPAWDDPTESGLYKAAIQGAQGPLSRHPSLSAEDIVQDMIVGFSTGSRQFGEPVLNVFRSVGEKYKSEIAQSPQIFRKIIFSFAKRRAKAKMRTQMKNQEVSHNEMNTGESVGFADQNPKTQWDMIWFALGNIKDPNGRALYSWLESLIEKVTKSEREQSIIRLYFEKARFGGDPGLLTEVSRLLDVDRTYVSKVIRKFTDRAARALAADKKIHQVLDRILIKHHFEFQKHANAKKASSHASLRTKVIRLAHVLPKGPDRTALLDVLVP